MATTAAVEAARRRLGAVGAWLPPSPIGGTPMAVEREQAARIERLGYGSLWGGQSPSNPGMREVMTRLGVWLAATERLPAGSGIANIMGRLPGVMQSGAATLAEAHPGRVILGLGAGHQFQADALGLTYKRPVERMRTYLDQMDAAAGEAPGPAEPFLRVLAALHPGMMALARERADGAHPFLVPVAHTAEARSILGPDKLLVPHQAVLLETDPDRARATVRGAFRIASIYAQNLRRFGFGDEDFADGPSDRLVDALVAWGDEAAVARRVREHLDAGADHVLIHPLVTDQPLLADLPRVVDQLERLAPALELG